MDSDLSHQQQQQQVVNNINSGLTRYRSAPSSYFVNLMNSGTYVVGDDDCDQFLESIEQEVVLSRFGPGEPAVSGSVKSEQLGFYPHRQRQQQQQQRGGYENHSGAAPGHDSAAVDDSFVKIGVTGNSSNLVRQSSSPAGLFRHINIEKDYREMRTVGDNGADSRNVANPSFSSAKRLKTELDFSSRPPSSARLTRFKDAEDSFIASSSSTHDVCFVEPRGKKTGYVPSFTNGSWDDSIILTDTFLNEFGDNDVNTFSSLISSEDQDNEGRNSTPGLTHHLSLPASSTDMENLLQFQDSVPLRSRAKRGCATHPRSIAERVRRTRISERIRKLQELVPNMDKQTNTADMLDLAVDYIKELQKQVETLMEDRSRCTCSK